MRLKLAFFHLFLGHCKAVADFLGCSLRTYMEIRRRVFSGEALTKRTLALLEKKLAELLGSKKFISKGAATVPLHIKPYRTEKSAACHREFDKCRRKIQTMIQAGKNRKDIYEHLTGAGRLTMSYSGFCRFISQEIDSDPTFLTMQSTAKAGSKRRATSPNKRSLKR